MADNLVFNTATYATNSMRPDTNEELTADWARKIMENTGRAAGFWGTFFATNTSVATLGTALLYFTGFNHPPSLDLWIVENGNLVGQWQDAYTPASESGRIVGKQVRWSSAAGTGTLHLMVFPHPAYGYIAGPENFNFDQGSYGTWIYRMRGV